MLYLSRPEFSYGHLGCIWLTPPLFGYKQGIRIQHQLQIVLKIQYRPRAAVLNNTKHGVCPAGAVHAGLLCNEYKQFSLGIGQLPDTEFRLVQQRLMTKLMNATRKFSDGVLVPEAAKPAETRLVARFCTELFEMTFINELHNAIQQFDLLGGDFDDDHSRSSFCLFCCC